MTKKGVKIKQFKDNCHGDDWKLLYIQRHNLTQHSTVKPTGAEIDSKRNAFFENFEEEAQNIPMENICNFNESNVTNDCGAKVRKDINVWNITHAQWVCDWRAITSDGGVQV